MFHEGFHISLCTKCTVCIDSVTDECQVVFSKGRDLVRCILFDPIHQQKIQSMLVIQSGNAVDNASVYLYYIHKEKWSA